MNFICGTSCNQWMKNVLFVSMGFKSCFDSILHICYNMDRSQQAGLKWRFGMFAFFRSILHRLHS